VAGAGIAGKLGRSRLKAAALIYLGLGQLLTPEMVNPFLPK
jgi:hypothetical protein